MPSNLRIWIQAFRLRTLPLALSATILGSIPQFHKFFINGINFNVFTSILVFLTAASLQILSNLANDYGDFINGADKENRIGPKRVMQEGLVSKKTMLRAIIINSIISFLLGISLLIQSYPTIKLSGFIFFLSLGILSIIAAITYTANKKPYGYRGLGDLSVFIFFGLVGIVGTDFLLSGEINYSTFYLGIAFGALSVMVLNINNMRDIESDRLAGKNTLVVKMGFNNAKIYHEFLMILAGLTIIRYIFTSMNNNSVSAVLSNIPVIILIAIILIKHIVEIKKITQPILMAPLLKNLSLNILLICILLFINTLVLGIMLN
jgi:1,4-dihydroxy-2-naphthoate octaprenyltransferase